MPKTPVGDRGFSNYAKFTDTHGSEVTLRESSSAREPCVWLFTKNQQKVDVSPHLNLEQATAVRDALSEWIKDHEHG